MAVWSWELLADSNSAYYSRLYRDLYCPLGLKDANLGIEFTCDFFFGVDNDLG